MKRARDCIVLQARLRSKRLPGKLLLPLGGRSVLECILERLSKAEAPHGVIIATTRDTEPLIRRAAEEFRAEIVVGSEEDVLGRYVLAAELHGLRHVVRATADNPLVSIEHIDQALLLHRESGADLTAFPSLPLGTGVEVVRASILEEIAGIANDPSDREHVTQYIYRNEGNYRVVRGKPEPVFQRPDVRLTVDTDEDYRKIFEIYEHLYRGTPLRLADVLKYLDRAQEGSTA